MNVGDIVEKEVAIRVARETEKLREELHAQGLDLAIARWAIAGILSRNLHMNINVDPTLADDIPLLMRLIGASAGESFLYNAELQFKQHAEHAEVLANARQKNWTPHISTDSKFECSRAYWPKP
jgi:hypothetical protein